MRRDQWELVPTPIPTIHELFDMAMRNPKAGLNRAGRAIGKHHKGKLNAHKNRLRFKPRWSVATLEYQRKLDRERLASSYRGSV